VRGPRQALSISPVPDPRQDSEFTFSFDEVFPYGGHPDDQDIRSIAPGQTRLRSVSSGPSAERVWTGR
jgi:hypothetical protein